jgi:hypothetical protein
MATKTKQSNALHSVEVCGDEDEVNGGSGGQGHPKGVDYYRQSIGY